MDLTSNGVIRKQIEDIPGLLRTANTPSSTRMSDNSIDRKTNWGGAIGLLVIRL